MAIKNEEKGYFKKGQSGNPSGRPKGLQNTATRLKRFLELTQSKNNPVTGEIEEFTIMEQMDMAQIAKALKGDIKAYQEILDRLEGKAKQVVDTNINATVNTPVTKWADKNDSSESKV